MCLPAVALLVEIFWTRYVAYPLCSHRRWWDFIFCVHLGGTDGWASAFINGQDSVDRSYEKVAYTLGKSPIETVLKITLPLAWKGLLAGTALSFARALGEFGATLMIAGNIPQRTQTMPLAIFEATQSGNDQLAFGLVALLTVISLVVLFSINRLGARW
jgi:ABC-type molybdate transport system permease subunit